MIRRSMLAVRRERWWFMYPENWTLGGVLFALLALVILGSTLSNWLDSL